MEIEKRHKLFYALAAILFLTLAFTAGPAITTDRSLISPATASARETLIKGKDSTVYYLGDDGKRYVFPNEAIYFSWYHDFSNVVSVPAAELASYPLAGNVLMRPGTKLIKTDTDAAVYAVLPAGNLLKIKNEDQARMLYGKDWTGRIANIPESLLSDYHLAGELSDGQIPAGSLVQKTGTGDFYYFDGASYRHVSDMDSLRENRFQLENALALTISNINAGARIKGRDTALLARIQDRKDSLSTNLAGVIPVTDLVRIAGLASAGGASVGSSGSSGGERPKPAPTKPPKIGNSGGGGKDFPDPGKGTTTKPVNDFILSQSQRLIHDQEFVIPADATNGDIVGRLNSFWRDKDNRNVSFSLSGSTAFYIDADGVIRISDARSLAGQANVKINVRADEPARQIYEEAEITVKILPTASTIYIDPTASANGNGTRENPYRSWAGISISSGKNYLQKRGTEISLNQRINVGSNNNVLIGAYGNSVNRPKVKIYNLKGGTNAAISMTGNNITVRDIDIDAKLSITGIYSGGGDNNRLDGVRIQNSEWGLRTMNAANGFKMLNSEIAYTGDDGHYSQNHDNMELAHNYIHHVNQHWNENSYWYRGKTEAQAPGDGIQLNGTILGFNIHHNIIDRSDTDNKFCVIVSPAQNNAVSNGRLENNHCTLRPNGNESGFYVFRGVFGAKVRYNTFVNGTGVYSHSKDLVVSNNDFFRSRLFTEFGGDELVFDNKFID